MIVTFCGHKDVYDTYGTIRPWLIAIVKYLIEQGADLFYLGGYGRFDNIEASVVREMKAQHPSIQGILVLPYLDSTLDTTGYDGTTYPPLENVPPRFAISKRNEWMVREAEVLVACVLYKWGGAYKTL